LAARIGSDFRDLPGPRHWRLGRPSSYPQPPTPSGSGTTQAVTAHDDKVSYKHVIFRTSESREHKPTRRVAMPSSTPAEPVVEEDRVCPECGSEHLVRDYARGELVCDSCGLVISEGAIDEGPEG